MSLQFLRKAVLAGVFGAAALAGGRAFWPSRTPASKSPPTVAEFVRDSREVVLPLAGTFNYPDENGEWRWEFKFPPGTTRQQIDQMMRDEGCEQFFDPFHKGTNFRKVVNGHWYHYIVLHNESRIEVHWEKSEPGTFPHMADVASDIAHGRLKPW